MRQKTILSPILFLGGCSLDYHLFNNQQKQQEQQEQQEPFVQEPNPDNPDSGEVPVECPYTDEFDQRPETPVDILVVADRSGSMYGDRERVEAGLETFINTLPARSWQFLVISANDEMVRYESRTPLLPGATGQDASDMYNDTSDGQVENGLRASMLYIDTYASWFNTDAVLHMIYISDEDDYSWGYSSDDNDVLATTKAWIDNSAKDISLASVVNIEYPLCTGDNDEIGTRYMEITDYVGGEKVDICSDGDQWGKAITDIKTYINPYESYELTYRPIERTLEVTVDGNLMAQGTQWTYQNKKIFFSDVPAAEAHVEMSYDIDIATTKDICPF